MMLANAAMCIIIGLGAVVLALTLISFIKLLWKDICDKN